MIALEMLLSVIVKTQMSIFRLAPSIAPTIAARHVSPGLKNARISERGGGEGSSILITSSSQPVTPRVAASLAISNALARNCASCSGVGSASSIRARIALRCG